MPFWAINGCCRMVQPPPLVPGCSQNCIKTWDELLNEWVPSGRCPPGCDCPDVPFDGAYDGQRYTLRCGGEPPEENNSDCPGLCKYIVRRGRYVVVEEECPPGCKCPRITSTPCGDDEVRFEHCGIPDIDEDNDTHPCPPDECEALGLPCTYTLVQLDADTFRWVASPDNDCPEMCPCPPGAILDCRGRELVDPLPAPRQSACGSGLEFFPSPCGEFPEDPPDEPPVPEPSLEVCVYSITLLPQSPGPDGSPNCSLPLQYVLLSSMSCGGGCPENPGLSAEYQTAIADAIAADCGMFPLEIPCPE